MRKINEIEKILKEPEVTAEQAQTCGNNISWYVISRAISGLVACSIITIIAIFFESWISPLTVIEIGSFKEVFFVYGIFCLVVLIGIIVFKKNQEFWNREGAQKSLKKYHIIASFYDLLTFIFTAFAGIYIVLMFVITPATVVGPSMENTLIRGDRLFVYHLFYNEPSRGDVVVINASKISGETDDFFVKRVVGLPGDTLRFEDHELFINGERYYEDYLANIAYQCHGSENYTIVLADDEYYVLGDNRAESRDSRNFGPISKDILLGKVICRIFPNLRAF